MPELRILNGYHRGATLPLDGGTLSIGGSEDADVVLADPNLAADHARLRADDGGWSLEPQDGPVRGEFDNLERDRVVLGQGQFARVGPIWITVCDGADPWQDPPPEPADSVVEDVPEPAPAEEPVLDAPAAVDAEAPAVAVAPAPRGRRIVLLPLMAAIVLSGAAYALTTQPDGTELAGADLSIEAPRLAAPQKLAPEALRQALRKRLAEIDLLERVTLDLGAREWTIRASLREEESERLQRALQAFERRYALDIPVHVRIGSPESMLPFRIAQVMSGDDACIILEDGRRLYVGDEYRGVRLAAVAGNRLRFTGRQTLEIAW